MTKKSVFLQVNTKKEEIFLFKIKKLYSEIIPTETLSKKSKSKLSIIMTKAKEEEWPCLDKIEMISILTSKTVRFRF